MMSASCCSGGFLSGPLRLRVQNRQLRASTVYVSPLGKLHPEGDFTLNFGGAEGNSAQVQRFRNLSQQCATLPVA